jgi:hypothetical protein
MAVGKRRSAWLYSRKRYRTSGYIQSKATYMNPLFIHICDPHSADYAIALQGNVAHFQP